MNRAEKVPEELLLTAWQFNQTKFIPYVPLEEVGVDLKILAYWRREGLLPFIQRGKWAKVSFMQLIWIWVLDAARKLGLPVKRLKDLTEYFILRAYHDDLPRKNLEYHRDRLEKQAALSPLSIEDLELLKGIKVQLADEILLYAFKWDTNYFSNLVTESILNEKEGGIMIFPDFISEYVHTGYRVFPDRVVDQYEPHINIPLRNFLKVFIKHEELNRYLRVMDILSEEENNVLSEIRNNNIKSITIIKNDKSGRLRIDSMKSGRITDEQATAIKDILGLKSYESITLDTVDNKNIYFKKTKKKFYGV